MTRIGLALFSAASFLVGQTPQQGVLLSGPPVPVGVGLSPVPLYPPDGVIPEQFKDQYVFLDTQTLDVVVVTPAAPSIFPSVQPTKRTIQRIELASHVNPSVSVKVSKNPSGTYSYTYTVTNDAKARQAIRRWFVSVPTYTAPDPSAGATNPAKGGGWAQSSFMREPGVSDIQMEGTSKSNYIQPGQSLSVTIESKYRPGIITLHFQGDVADLQQPGLAAPVLQQLALFQNLDFNSASVLAVGPNFVDSASNSEIAAHFQVAISQLMRRGAVKADSTYAPAVLASLSGFVSSGGIAQTPNIAAKPASDSNIEQQIHTAMQLSLGIQ